MGQVQWRTATNPLHTYQIDEGPVSTYHENDKTRKVLNKLSKKSLITLIGALLARG